MLAIALVTVDVAFGAALLAALAQDHKKDVRRPSGGHDPRSTQAPDMAFRTQL